MNIHPLAEIFPLIEGTRFEELTASIKQNGLRDPIILLGDAILDGRNRYRACLAAGIEPRFEPFTGDDPASFVWDRNANRRHWTVGQRGIAAAALAKAATGYAGHKCRNTGTTKTNAEVAAMAGVNKETISDAKTILAKGTPEQIAAVKNGAAISTVARTVRERKAIPTGRRVTVKGGKTILDAAREGMERERAGAAVPDVARHIGLSVMNYTWCRDVLLLSERDDLTNEERAIVRKATRDIDETHQVGRAGKLIEPIVKRVFLPKHSRIKGKVRTADFENSIESLARLCANAIDIPIPILTDQQARKATLQLDDAAKALAELTERIKGGRP